MALLVEGLREQDQVAIVVYAGSSGLVLPPTSGDRQADDPGRARLARGGRLDGGRRGHRAGLPRRGRDCASRAPSTACCSRPTATSTSASPAIGELARLIEEKRKGGVFLSVLGFGMGNLKDATMEMLADKGNGNYSYIDSEAEARKVLVSEAGATLVDDRQGRQDPGRVQPPDRWPATG